MSGLRWGVLGTANIARAQFLPAVAESGGHAVVVGSRDGDHAARWATEHGVDRGVSGYEAVLADPQVQAVYVPLPNPLHAQWAIAALAAGKAVLCEKPLCLNPVQAEEVLVAAAGAAQPLWEAFVFPFQAQHQRVRALLADGAIGELREIVSAFHFPLARAGDARLSAEMGGGALADVGCYPLRLAHELFGAEPTGATVSAVHGDEVEVDAAATLDYPGGRRLLLTCGFRRASDTTTLLLGTEGTLRIDNPFHPSPDDTLELRRGGERSVERPTVDARSFTAALRHISAVVAGEEAPRQTAADSALPVVRALALTQAQA